MDDVDTKVQFKIPKEKRNPLLWYVQMEVIIYLPFMSARGYTVEEIITTKAIHSRSSKLEIRSRATPTASAIHRSIHHVTVKCWVPS